MNTARKYTFDLSFDERDEKLLEEEAAVRAAEARRQAEVEAKVESAREAGRKEGYETGKAEGLEEKQRETESLAANAQNQIAAQLAVVAAKQDGVFSQNMESAVEAAVLTVKKLFPGFARKHGLVEIETLIAGCLDRLLVEPRVLVRVHPDVADTLRGRIKSVSQQAGYGGKIAVVVNEDITPDGCQVEWQDGMAERDSEQIWSEIKDVLDRYIEIGGLEMMLDQADDDPVPDRGKTAEEQ